MLLIAKIAYRNLIRHLRRTVLTVASISFGLAVILWLQCLLAGRNQTIIKSITSTYIGQVQVFKKEYLKDRVINFTFPGVPPGFAEMLPQGSHFSPRMHLPALVSSGEASTPIVLEGIEPEAESAITTIRTSLKEGAFLDPDPTPDCQSRQIYIGKAMADLLNVKVGNKIVILAQATDGSLGNDLFRVKGIYDSGSPQFNKTFAFAPASCVKKVGVLAGIHEITIQLPTEVSDTRVQEILKAHLPPEFTVTTWRQAVPNMAAMVKFNDAMLLMISTILFTVITFGIVNSLLMSVFERTREFGTMISLGTTPGQVRTMVVAESLFMALASALFGIVLGGAAVLYHQKFGFDLRPFLGEAKSIDNFQLELTIYPAFEFIAFLKATFVTIFVVLCAGLYPAIRASKLNPHDAMR
ncbi:FtsX-like permease family protein [Bdellovibrionota bacterium FG-2]